MRKNQLEFTMTFCAVAVLVLLAIMGSGCAKDNSNQIAFFTAYNQALANCKGEVGCIAGTQAALYSGRFNEQEDTATSLIAATLPWGRLLLEWLALYRGSAGGGNGVYVKGNNNQFLGFNKLVADRSSTVTAPFDATASIPTTQTWTDMYNLTDSRNEVK